MARITDEFKNYWPNADSLDADLTALYVPVRLTEVDPENLFRNFTHLAAVGVAHFLAFL